MIQYTGQGAVPGFDPVAPHGNFSSWFVTQFWGQGREAQPTINPRQGREVQRKETDDRV